MQTVKIQLLKGKQPIDSVLLEQVFHRSGIKPSFIVTEINPEASYDLLKGVRYSKPGFSYPYDTNCELFVHKATEIAYPVTSELKIIALINGVQSSEYQQYINVEFLNSAYIVLAKAKPIQLDALKKYDLLNRIGTVHLVGAGGGKLDMLTVKGHRLVKQADVVLYDKLVGEDILDEISGKKVFVGKRAGDHSKSQDEINNMLLEAAYTYKNIVRLKGGDPNIFGHAAEEIAFLEAHFAQVEVIPGISSALSASALSHSPLTVRGVSKSVAFCSGHEKTNIEVPDTDTIVYFMGANNLKSIARALRKKNFMDTTPIKLIYNIGAADEAVYLETIESILGKENHYKAPIITIVGNVSDKAYWRKAFMEKKRILYTGTHIDKYAHLGYVTHHPMIELAPMPDSSEIDKTIGELQKYDWIVFTSAYAVKFLFDRMYDLGLDSRIFSGIKVVSIGKNTSHHLKNHGLVPDIQPEDESSEGILDLMISESIVDKDILIPRSDKALPFLPKALEGAGNRVKSLKVYTNILPKKITKINPDNFDQVIFASPSGVDNFVRVYGHLPKDTELIYKGKETLKALKKNGYHTG